MKSLRRVYRQRTIERRVLRALKAWLKGGAR